MLFWRCEVCIAFKFSGAKNEGFGTLRSKVRRLCDFVGRSLHCFWILRSEVYIVILKFAEQRPKINGKNTALKQIFFAFPEKINVISEIYSTMVTTFHIMSWDGTLKAQRLQSLLECLHLLLTTQSIPVQPVKNSTILWEA